MLRFPKLKICMYLQGAPHFFLSLSLLTLYTAQGDLHFAGDGRPASTDAVGTDLAVLAACNHTIESYGAFSFMAGGLAGGLVVIPEHFDEYRYADADFAELAVADPLEDPIPAFHFGHEMTRRSRWTPPPGL